MSAYAAVILDDAIERALDYAVPEHLQGSARPGMRVLVPVQKRFCKGTILTLKAAAEVASVKPLSELLSEEPLVSEDLFELAHWISRYYCAPLYKVLKVILPPILRETVKEKKQLFIEPAISVNALASLCETLRQKKPTQAKVLDVLLKFPKGILLTKLLEEAEVSRSPVERLIEQKILHSLSVQIDRSVLGEVEYFQTQSKVLSEEQESALAKIRNSLDASRFETHLLYGVTGSGKTEIYLQAIEEAIKTKKGVIFLVPEIALTSQTIERLKGRFKEKIAILHHRLSHGERYDAWHHIRKGSAQIVVGARSALFSPVKNLGLIIVDEEHESSYKQQEEAPCYHARDVAVMRGKFSSATVVLGSATPSLESYYNALRGKYILSCLMERPAKATLPTVSIVDMRHEFEKAKRITLFSESLLHGIEKRLKTGEQTLLFLNRRGYHTAQLCSKCSHVIKCPHCEVALTFHLGENQLACHLCDYRLQPPPRECPSCHSLDGLKYRGAGTELVERSLHAIFPEIRTLRLDADTTRHKGSHEQLFKQFRSGKADLLIGTQMVAKGLHFPSVTLVGVLNADASLSLPDFRASEQVFQLITQVAGRSGRGQLPGEVIIQTSLPEHPIILQAANQDFPAFYAGEIAVRELFSYPPFSHLVKLTFTSTSDKKALEKANALRALLIQNLPPTFELYPVTPCGHAKIKDQYRFQLLIKAEQTAPITQALRSLAPQLFSSSDVRLSIDVDPVSTYL